MKAALKDVTCKEERVAPLQADADILVFKGKELAALEKSVETERAKLAEGGGGTATIQELDAEINAVMEERSRVVPQSACRPSGYRRAGGQAGKETSN